MAKFDKQTVFCWKTFTGELQCLGANLFCIRRHLRLVVAFTTQWWTCNCLKTTLPLKMGDLKRRGYFSKTEGCFVFELRAVAVRGPHKQLLLLMTSKLKTSLQFWTSRSIKSKFMMDILIHWCLFCYYLFMALECKSNFNRNIHVGVPVGQS